MTDKKDPVTNPLQRLWRACLLIFACVVLLNITVTFLQPILPWLIGGLVVACLVWVVVSIVRWRQSRW